MRILQVISHYVPAYSFGGPLQMAHGLGQALVRLGHEVTVCCTNLQDANSSLAMPLDVPVETDGVRVFYEAVPFLRYWGYSPGMRRRLAMECVTHDVVFTHFHYQYASFIGGGSARRAGKPYVVFTHGSLNLHGLTARGHLRKRLYLALLEARNFRHARFVAYQSAEELRQSLHYGQTEIVPIGINDELLRNGGGRGRFRARHPEAGSRFIFLYLGRLAPGKGLDILLPAFESVTRARDCHLLLVGGDERGYRRLICEHMVRLGIQGRVTFTGLLSGEAKLEALRDADVLVLPSRSEGLSVAALEALAMKLPVLITDRVGIWRDVVTRNCGAVVNYSVQGLEHAMNEMMDHPDRRGMGERGRRWVTEQYNWSRIAEDLVRKIQERPNLTEQSRCKRNR